MAAGCMHADGDPDGGGSVLGMYDRFGFSVYTQLRSIVRTVSTVSKFNTQPVRVVRLSAGMQACEPPTDSFATTQLAPTDSFATTQLAPLPTATATTACSKFSNAYTIIRSTVATKFKFSRYTKLVNLVVLHLYMF